MKALFENEEGLRIEIEFPDPKFWERGSAEEPTDERREELEEHLQKHLDNVLRIFGNLVARIAQRGMPLACPLFHKVEGALKDEASLVDAVFTAADSCEGDDGFIATLRSIAISSVLRMGMGRFPF